MAVCPFKHFFTFLFIIGISHSVEPKSKLSAQQNSEEWMNRFSAQFVKTFAQYTRLDTLTDEFSNEAAEPIFEKTSKSLLESVNIVKQGLQDYFDEKFTLLGMLSTRLKLLFAKLILTNLIRKISVKDTFSAIHITLDSYKCDNQVMQDFDWTESQELEASMKDNYRKDPSIRQYIGTYSGLTRIYPGLRWDLNPTFEVDLFDPRYRPWFVVAETAPRDIVFLIDYSGSAKGQNIHLTKMTIMYILATLTPNDYFTGIWYNSKKEFVLSECCSANFLPATSRNKRLFKRYLDKIEEKDQAFLPTALNMSFTQFIEMNQSRSSGGHKLIMLFTDGIEFWPTEEIREYQDQHPNDIIRVFGYSMGRGTGTQAALEWISCMTNAGGYEIVDSISDVRRKSRGYLTKLSEILSLAHRQKSISQRPVSWPIPYMDAQKRGIAAIDFTFDKLKDLLQEFGGAVSNTYAFIIDNNGIVYYHPNMKIPKKEVYLKRISTLIKSGTRVHIPTMDILEIELRPSFIFEKLRKRMIDGKCKEGDVLEDSEREYYCMPIKGTPLTVAFVRDKGKLPFSSATKKEKSNALKYLKDNNLVGYWLKDGKSPCNDEVASFAALKRFHKLIQLSKQKQCVIQGLDQKHPLLTGSINSAIQKWHDSWPLEYDEEVDDLALNVTKNLEAVCRDSEELYLLPSTFDGKYFVDSFVEFVPAGLVSFYPNVFSQYSTLTPILHKKDAYQAKEYSAKIYIDLTPSANVLTASKDMHGQHNQLLANVGCQFTANFIHDKFQRSMAVNDRSWMACKMKDTRCLLVTSSGYADEPQLFDTLLRKNILKVTKWRDYQEECLMPKSDGRQQFQGNTAMAAPAAASRNTGFHDVLSAMQFLGNKMAGLAASLMWFEFSIFIRQSFEQSSYLKDECDFENLEMVEQCAMEHTHYNLNVDQTVTLKAVLRTGCFGNLTISPASDTALNCFQRFLSYKIPDCNMTTPKYRKPRSDMDYTTSHPQESINLCSSAPVLTFVSITTVTCSISVLLLPFILKQTLYNIHSKNKAVKLTLQSEIVFNIIPSIIGFIFTNTMKFPLPNYLGPYLALLCTFEAAILNELGLARKTNFHDWQHPGLRIGRLED
uniref:VWFA domain-containing protein n=1 Tax=Ditylenchus dipsaci TaxID=166011 RepID=A0A915CLH5_9BILA